MKMNRKLTRLTVTVLPAPVGRRTSTKVNSELYLSTVVTTDNVEIGVAVGITSTMLVSIRPVSVTLICVYVVGVIMVVTCCSRSVGETVR